LKGTYIFEKDGDTGINSNVFVAGKSSECAE
jgi:hypothetical protein